MDIFNALKTEYSGYCCRGKIGTELLKKINNSNTYLNEKNTSKKE